MEQNTKICSRCKEPKQASEFYKDNSRRDGLSLYCKHCRRKANDEYELRKAEPGYKTSKRIRENNASPFRTGSFKNDIFIHFWRFGKELDEEQIERIIRRLYAAESYWKEMDAIESELGCGEYEVNLLEILRQDRERINISRDRYRGNLAQPVKMLSLDGDYIRTFNTISDASQFVCGHRSKMAGAIGNAAAGLCLSSNGYIWEFTDC